MTYGTLARALSCLGLMSSHAPLHVSSVFKPFHRPCAAKVQLDIAARMSGLEELDLVLKAVDDTMYPALLREERGSFAEALAVYSEQLHKVTRASLKEARFCEIPWEDPLADLTYPQGYDLVGAALRVWSQRLERFNVEGSFDGSLF